MTKQLLCCIFILCFSISRAQEMAVGKSTTPFSIGLGAGLDYGGIGIKIPMISFTPWAQLFGGVGYNGADVGFNAGGLIRSDPERQVSTYVTAMYGYNAVLITESIGGTNRTERTYYGPSFGVGVEYRSRPGGNFFSLGLLVPIRSKKFENAVDTLDPIRNPPVVALSVGYHISFKKCRSASIH
jgi:hypothetical protein